MVGYLGNLSFSGTSKNRCFLVWVSNFYLKIAMREQHKLTSLLFSILGVWLLLVPMSIELYHSLSDLHISHEVCTEQTTHLHQKPLDCSICDFHPSLFTYQFHEIELGINDLFYPTVFLPSTSLLPQEQHSFYLLRAPPTSV